MRGKVLLTAFVFGCASLCTAQPGLAAGDGGDLLKSMEKGGWQTVAPGVMQRSLGAGKVETLGFGADGLRFKIQEMTEHLSFLRQEYANHPTPKVRKSIQRYRAEIARLTEALETAKSLDEEEGLKALNEKASGGIDCTIKYSAHVNAFPLTGSQGVGANTDASFSSNCGQVGEVYAHSYSKATGADNVIRTATHTEPPSGIRSGSNVTAVTSDNVLGVRDCYSYSYATMTSYDIGVSYSQSVENRLCPATVSPLNLSVSSNWGGTVEVYGTNCVLVSWTASASGGTSPYSYAWYNGSTYLGAGASYTRSFCGNNTTKTQLYSITATATDSTSPTVQTKSVSYPNTIYYYGSSNCIQQSTADDKAISPTSPTICPY
ncbi:MAG TPA: hypothetical protein VLQ45_01395 [Thermoanaerobaculia bacterium]|nr:hypothetical protein [Thermoanaerobaculia bacterium]